TGLDTLDEPLVVAGGANPDAVAGGHDVAFLGGHRLEQPADGAAKQPAVLQFDDALQPMHAQHAAEQAGAHVHRRHVRALFLVLNDGPLAAEIALRPDAFLRERGVVGPAVLLKRARPVALARRLRAVFPHIHADFFLLRHGKHYTFADGGTPSPPQIRNPNIEIRNKSQCPKPKCSKLVLDFEFRNCFGFRYSDFGFLRKTWTFDSAQAL